MSVELKAKIELNQTDIHPRSIATIEPKKGR